MENKIFLFIASIFLLASCGTDPGSEPLPQARQVDMSVVVPIHPSSLEYFDYVLTYYDNDGKEYADVVDDAVDGSEFYSRTFSYGGNLPVVCTMTVDMVPKEGCTSVESFTFYIPKPYITPCVFGHAASTTDSAPESNMEGSGSIHIEPMSISDFQSIYGKYYTSTCGVYPTSEGYEIFFY